MQIPHVFDENAALFVHLADHRVFEALTGTAG